ncbi:glycosyltransferase family 4 protein [Clostridium carnis]
MHILIIPSAYPTEDAILRGTFYKEQAIAIKEHGNKVGVIYSETRRVTGINIDTVRKNHFQISETNESGVNTIRLHGWNIFMMRNSIGINLWIKQSIKLFKVYVEKYGKPDIVHAHCGLYGGYVAKIIKDKYNIPYVITEHSSNVLNNNIDGYNKKLLCNGYKNADCLISVSKKLKDKMRKFTNNNIKVIPNIVDTTKFTPKRLKENDKFRFISVSFLNKNKCVDLTIKAFFKSFNNMDNVELYIIGDGFEKDNLKNLIIKLKLESKVKLIGSVQRENLATYLNEAHCFVLPTLYETFGVAYIEALACGLPIIATKSGGPEDFFNENLGYIINVSDEEALIEAMTSVFNDYKKFDSKYISEYIKGKFSPKVIVNSLENVYKEVIKR